MRTFFYKSARFLKFIPLNRLIEISGQKVIFPFYHLVADKDVIHVKHLYKARKVKEFESDLEFFLKEYNPLAINELIDSIIKGSWLKKKGFLLSFDDGLSEFNDVIAPILLKKGIPAICFLNSGFIDNKDLFFRYKASILIEKIREKPLSDRQKKRIRTWIIQKNLPFSEKGAFLLSVDYINRLLLDEFAELLDVDFREYLKQYRPYLTSEQVISLSKQGFTFGAHSIDHPRYSDLPEDIQVYQTIQSTKEIADKFNPDYKLFSFPFTDQEISMQFFNSLFNNIQHNVDLTFGCAGLKKDQCNRNIQRIPVEIGNFSARDVIYGEYIYYLFKMLVDKNTIKRN